MEDHENLTFVFEHTTPFNLGTTHKAQELKIRKSLTLEKQEKFIALLKEFMDVFAWS